MLKTYPSSFYTLISVKNTPKNKEKSQKYFAVCANSSTFAPEIRDKGFRNEQNPNF